MGPRFPLDPGLGLVFREVGAPVGELLARAGLPADALGGTLVDARTYFALWRALEEVTKDPQLPLTVALRYPVEVFQPALFAALASPHLGAALERLSDHKQLLGPLRFSLRWTGRQLTLTLRYVSDAGMPPEGLVLTEMAFLVRLARLGTRESIRPESVSLRRTRPHGSGRLPRPSAKGPMKRIGVADPTTASDENATAVEIQATRVSPWLRWLSRFSLAAAIVVGICMVVGWVESFYALCGREASSASQWALAGMAVAALAFLAYQWVARRPAKTTSVIVTSAGELHLGDERAPAGAFESGTIQPRRSPEGATYQLELCINGAAAHLNKPGDVVILATDGEMENDEAIRHVPKVVRVDTQNRLFSTEAERPGPEMPKRYEIPTA